ncbi:MAG: hypothetical protein GKS05_09920 [Nitrospirales bacterium]|nr:hypothetical protein [Nitrospirales bacterium]
MLRQKMSLARCWYKQSGMIALALCVLLISMQIALAQDPVSSPNDEAWLEEIQHIFVPSDQCKQCHDRHYEEWKGMREQTPDLKSFGRVDGALLHGTALTSPVFQTVLGLWLETDPTQEERTKCLSCHVPAVTVFPQHTDNVIAQVMAGPKHVKVEGIGCSACHLIKSTVDHAGSPPTFKIEPSATMYGPYDQPEENLVHPSHQAQIYNGANYCAACHFSKVKDVTSPSLSGEILKGTICQDCHMEPSTGSSTSKRGALTRPIGRHWFQGIVIPGIMLSNRNLQAEWFSRVDIDVTKMTNGVGGTVLVRNGSLPHMFPGGDPVLKQFFVTIHIKDQDGNLLAKEEKRFGLGFDEILRGPIPTPLVNGGVTRKIPFFLNVPEGKTASLVEAVLSYALIPKPDEAVKSRYIATLKTEHEKKAAHNIIEDYSTARLLTFRTKDL